MLNDTKDKNRGIFLGTSYWDDCGDIFIGKDSLKAVYMKRQSIEEGKPNYEIIWPAASKYVLYATNKYEENAFKDTLFDNVTVEPYENDVKIYIRSCGRNFGIKYDYAVFVAKDAQQWIKVNKQTVDDNGLYIENRGQSSKGVYDSVITITVSPNYNFSRRAASFTIIQYNQNAKETKTDTETGETKEVLAPTGKYYTFTILQKEDYIISVDYKDKEVEWYSDISYTTRVTGYTDEDLKANITDGITQLYFKLPGTLVMASGNKNRVQYYGTGEDDAPLDSTSFTINSGGNYISTINGVQHYGDGKWTANVVWKNNISTSEYTIKNLMHSPSQFKTSGGFGQLYFDIYQGGTSEDRNILLSVNISASTSRIICTQSGGTGEQKLILDDLSDIDVKIENESDISNLSKYGELSYSLAIGHYTIQTQCKSQPEQKLVWCSNGKMVENKGDDQFTKLNSFPYTGTTNLNQGVSFDIYYSPDYYKGSTYKVVVSYLGVSSQIMVRQTEDKGSLQKITDLSKISTLDGYTNFSKFQVSFKDKFKDKITVKGQDGKSDLPIYSPNNQNWYYQLLIPTNAGTAEGIFNITDIVVYNVEDDGYTPKSDGENEFISYKEHNSTSGDRAQIAFKINSAAADSSPITDQMLVVLLDTSNQVINNDTNIFVIEQGGSSDAGAAKYHTEFSPSTISIKNVTDNLDMVALLDENGPYSKSNQYYKAYIVCNENKEILDKSEVRTVPKEITNHSIGTVDNFNNTWIHIQVKGKNVYKGVERELEFSIKYNGENAGEAVTETVNQEANNAVELTDQNTPCEDLELSLLSLINNSQGTIIGADHTSDGGWYAVHIALTPNTDVIKKVATLYVNGELYLDEGTEVKSTVTLPSLVSSKYPITFKYDITGVPVERYVNLKIDGIDETIEEIWANVPFTGKIVTRNEYLKDWKASISYPEGSTQTSWLTIDSNHNLKSSTNSNKDDRTALLVITPLEETKEIVFTDDDKPTSSPFKFSVVQSSWYDDNNYILYIDNTYKSNNIIKMSNGKSTTIDIPITSYNTKTNTTVGIKLELVDSAETFSDVFTYSIDYSSNVISNGVLVSLTCKNQNNSTSNKTYTIKATQTLAVDGQDPNEITFKVTQYNYMFEVEKESIKLDFLQEKFVTINYTSITNNNESQRIEILNIPSWLICSTTAYGISFTQIEENTTSSNRSVNLTLKQKDSNITYTLNVEDTCYTDPLLSESSIQLYNSSSKSELTCTSNVNESYSTIFYQFVNSTLDEDEVVVSIDQGNDSNPYAKIVVSNSKMLMSTESYQNNMQYGTLQLYQKLSSGLQHVLGTVSVTRNAYKFRNATEEEHGTMTIELSPTREKLYSKYYVESFKNGGLISCKVTNNGYIYAYIDKDNVVYAYPLDDNDTGHDLKYYDKWVQNESGLIIDVTFIQHHK